MKQIISYFEKIIIIALLIMMGGIIIITTYELIVTLIKDLFLSSDKYLFLNVSELLQLFSFFLLVLIGLELFESIKIYLKENVLHVEVILVVAITAVARKVIVLDYNRYDAVTIFGIAALVLSLSLGYYLIKRSNRDQENK